MAGSPYTLETAREILLGKRSPAVKVLDRLLGAGMLAAGPVGLATGQPWLLAAWGWIDQKNELVARLDELVAGGRGKLAKATGRQRHQLLAATHTALVVGSFFAALRDLVGRAYADLALTDAEIARIVVAPASKAGLANVVRHLWQADAPLPWADGGFEDNLQNRIRGYYKELADRSFAFFAGFEPWVRHFGEFEGSRPLRDQVVDRAAERYRTEYMALAADVPEFRVWALFGEHLAEQRALGRLEELVGTLVSATRAPAATVRGAIAGINRAVLARNIVDLDETAHVTAVRAPTVADGYVEPHFRWAEMYPGAGPADENWWARQRRGTDLAGFLAAHFASPEAAERPLVVLGHPGAGKSLFTKVCAARLSDAFVTVRIPLRDVPDPSASVYQQIDEVLRESTHGKVAWAKLCAASKGLVRVVLIDGLDELMQATGATESRYLRNVMDFQRTEADTTGPVAVVVTSRTVVADLAAIPNRCLVVKLEEFTDEQIDTWVDRWSAANAAAVSSGDVRAVEAATLRGYGELARQPLLLLLLAIVAAERELPPSETSADLYRMLLDDFVRRELARPDQDAGHLAEEQRRTAELWKLGLVALGMLNRGQQHLHEQDLAADLAALPAPVPPPETRGRDVGRTLDPARRVVGRFFFVHASEAEAGAGGRSYEFLHATFGDYLIAHHAAELLRQASAARKQQTAFQPWDDDLLFALLSHTLLVAYGSRAVAFFAELVAGDEEVASVLEHLAGAAHDRWGKGRYADYDPSGRTVVRRLATYTANIVSLRLAMAGAPVPIGRLCPRDERTESWWPAQVRLWAAVLPRTQWAVLVGSMRRQDAPEPGLVWGRVSGYYEDMVEVLAFDDDRAMQLAAGRALMTAPEDLHHSDLDGPRDAAMMAQLLVTRAPTRTDLSSIRPASGDSAGLLRLRMSAITRHAADMEGELVRQAVRLCKRAGVNLADEDLAALAIQHSDAAEEIESVAVTPVVNAMFDLSALVDVPDDPFGSDGQPRLADTPEGRVVRTTPPGLARRLIPELAVARVRQRARPEADR